MGEFVVSQVPDPKVRRSQNLVLAVIAIPKVLYNYWPERVMSPDVRYHVVLRDVCRTIMGRADEGTVLAVQKVYETEEGPMAFLWHQVRRSSGSNICKECGKAYLSHGKEPRIGEGANLLCNGDLVHL
jgi:hypothetical protein